MGKNLNRRNFIIGLLTTGFIIATSAGKVLAAMTEKLVLSDEEWQKRLSDEQFQVLRKEATERPFTSPLNKEKRDGVFHCSGCDLELFTSDQKFDSGTGWPSFFDGFKDHIETRADYKMFYPRTEYHCARCGGHQGHIFKDGPKPTGLRYCNNGVALNFKKKG